MRIATRRTGGRTGWAAFGVLIAAAMGSAGTVLSAAAPAVPVPTPVGAAAASIAILNVDIWPEHDDPRVLIIYRGQLSANAPLPYTLTFTIPPSGQVNAAAYRSSEGALLSTDYQYRQDGDRLQVTFTVPERAFQFEYYADLITGRPRRSMAADVVVPLPVDAMRVSVEQPLRSTAFVLTPPADSTMTTPAGFTHYLYTIARWPAGRVWSVRATYQKADETPSLPRASAPARPPAPSSSGQAAGLSLWGWAAGGLALLGLGALAAFWMLQRRTGSRPLPGPGPGTGAPRKNRRRPGAQVRHCAQCGFRASPGDRFCSRCGRQLREQ